VFTCLFCNHERSVTVKIDKKAGVGQLDCRICGQKFQCAVNCMRLTESTLYDKAFLLTTQIYPRLSTCTASGWTLQVCDTSIGFPVLR
jgi:hypothetical protein